MLSLSLSLSEYLNLSAFDAAKREQMKQKPAFEWLARHHLPLTEKV